MIKLHVMQKKKMCVLPVTRPTLIFPSDPKVFIGIPKKNEIISYATYPICGHFYSPNFEKVGDIMVSACLCVCILVRDIVLKLHVWIPHGKIADMYFWFSLNYLPLLNYGPLTNKGMKFCKCCISKSIIARNLKLVSADRG